MVEPVRVQNWSAGANNIAPRDRLPEASVRELINLDPLPGGRIALRAKAQQISPATSARGLLALGRKLLLADGADLIEFDTATSSARVLRTIAAAGPLTGAVLNERLYFCTANEALEYDGQTVRPWGVPDVNQQPAVDSGAGGTLLLGSYQVAMTLTDQWGREGGTAIPAVINSPAFGTLTVQVPVLPSGCSANIYASAVNGQTLYLQRRVTASGSVAIQSIDDSSQRCETVLAWAPRAGHRVCAHNGVLAVALDNTVQITRPMRPHLIDRARDFFQYPRRVGDVLSAAGALFVSADRVYAIRSVETSEVTQGVVHEYPAIPGTAIQLPDGRGAWMTQYGQVIAGADGVQMVTRERYLPADAASGAVGVLEHNGNQLIISVLHGPHGADNPLASADSYLGEVFQ
ncbi:hypothetical protein EGJ23_01645 [Pseudomonas sp. o96-267]|uniref:hypothetical protein n=1 Tax=Pseudomonas sp. o96-267 TaxID=2479853 RepID=UPI000F7980C2|nr:hypothetical protein [Pseudomonas sp. o96-267]RRV29667.1 hypothetical protein EGJ23_01645 [Pseudomonas sp. o96-267]